MNRRVFYNFLSISVISEQKSYLLGKEWNSNPILEAYSTRGSLLRLITSTESRPIWQDTFAISVIIQITSRDRLFAVWSIEKYCQEKHDCYDEIKMIKHDCYIMNTLQVSLIQLWTIPSKTNLSHKDRKSLCIDKGLCEVRQRKSSRGQEGFSLPTLSKATHNFLDTKQCVYNIIRKCGRGKLRETGRQLGVWLRKRLLFIYFFNSCLSIVFYIS